MNNIHGDTYEFLIARWYNNLYMLDDNLLQSVFNSSDFDFNV